MTEREWASEQAGITVEFEGKFIDFGILRQKSFDDCQHIAAAILAGCDIITSWDLKHIVNVKTARGREDNHNAGRL